mmetsp:Transcript_9173/g.26359  ORF Transcript_9173/g.26359 Transcript_9173/m.26359 type:complete len:227 (+) Transcript_9173:86-766(+)
MRRLTSFAGQKGRRRDWLKGRRSAHIVARRNTKHKAPWERAAGACTRRCRSKVSTPAATKSTLRLLGRSRLTFWILHQADGLPLLVQASERADVLPQGLDRGVQVPAEGSHVDGLRRPLQAHATTKEVVKIDPSTVFRVQHIEETSCFADVNINGAEKLHDRIILQVILELLERDHTFLVLIQGPEQVARLRDLPDLVDMSGPLHGILHEGTGDHVHYGDDGEGHV